MAHSEPRRPAVLLLGPSLAAISGVTTHLQQLLASPLAAACRLEHFQVGSEGRRESRRQRLLRLLAAPLQLAGRLLFGRIDIVHINTSLNAQAFWRDFAYLLVARLFGRRVVWQVHGGPTPQAYCAGRPLFAHLLRAALRLADVVVVLASSQLDAYRRFAPGLAVQLLPNGIDPAPYAALARPPQPADAPLRLVYLGRLARAKGVFAAVDALRRALLLGLPVHLAIAGSGPDEGALISAADDLLRAGDMHFIGPTFGTAKGELLAAADVLLLPSDSEGLPYALLEAMAAGVPAIATPVGAIPDVMIDGQHGLLVPVGDVPAIVRAIARLLANRPLLARMAADCRQRVAASYSVTRQAAQFARLYGELCPPGRRAGVTVGP